VTDRSGTLKEARVIAFISGAGGGLGAEVARQLAGRGDTVILSARDPDRARRTASEIDGDARALPVGLDIADQASVDRAAAALADEPSALDVLVNNAAAYVDWTEVASAADLAAAHTVLETNLFGAWRLTNALLDLMRRSAHPRVVHVSSGAGSHADPAFGLTRRAGAAASYGISKAALNALTATQAAELAGSPVLVNAVCPGLTATFPGAEDMGARPVAESAAGIVWAASLPDDGPSGGFFRDGRPLGW
jgi:NAD(P)-dependent dehydrogenase (short-subunit alcohol dehydrogenase family)